MNDEGVWFEAKRFGYGSGWPVRWQGWALMTGFAGAAVLLKAALGGRHPLLTVGLLFLASVPAIVISARHTRGGWRWRWGGEA